MALSEKQRNAILDRDDNHSQMRHYSGKRGWFTNANCPYDDNPCNKLEVHHIVPQRMGGEDEPRNLITLTKCEHAGVCPEERMK